MEDTEFLEFQLEQYRNDERRRNEEENDQRRQRREDRRDRLESEYRTAYTWPEALEKQAYLMGKEVDEFDRDDHFKNGRDACNRGIEIWQEVATTKKNEIDELHRRLAIIQDEIRLEVSLKLKAECTGIGGKGIADSIEEDVNFRDFLNW